MDKGHVLYFIMYTYNWKPVNTTGQLFKLFKYMDKEVKLLV